MSERERDNAAAGEPDADAAIRAAARAIQKPTTHEICICAECESRFTRVIRQHVGPVIDALRRECDDWKHQAAEHGAALERVYLGVTGCSRGGFDTPNETAQNVLERFTEVETVRDEAITERDQLAARVRELEEQADEDEDATLKGLMNAGKEIAEWKHRAETAEAALTVPRPFPIQRYGNIPWSCAERAYVTYAKNYGNQQSLGRLAERGGFGIDEFLCLYYGCTKFNCTGKHPWPEEASLEYLPRRVADLERQLAARPRDPKPGEVSASAACGS